MNRIVLDAVRRFRWWMAVVIVAYLVIILVSSLSIVFFQKLLDQIVHVKSFDGLRNIFIAYLVFRGLQYISNYVTNYPASMVQQGIVQWAKVRAMKKISRIDYRAYQDLGTGQLVQMVNNGAEATSSIVNGFYLRAVSEIFPTVLINLLFIGFYDRTVMYVMIAGFAVILVLSNLLLGILQRKKELILTLEEDFSKYSVRGFMEMVVFRVNKRFASEIPRVDDLGVRVVRTKAELNMAHELFFVSFVLVVFAIELGVIYFQIPKIIAGETSIGVLVALVAFVHQVYFPASLLNVMYVSYKLNLVTLRRFNDFLSLPDDRNVDRTDDLNLTSGEVTLDAVTFAYGNRPVLNNLSITFARGKSTALVGTSGGGKSTIAKMVVTLLKPDSGRISIDEQDVAHVNLDSFYDHVAYLPQDPPHLRWHVSRESVVRCTGRRRTTLAGPRRGHVG